MAKMSQLQMEELQEAFVIFDRDNDNKISWQEFATVVRSIGFNPTEADLQAYQKSYGNKTLLNIQDCTTIINEKAPRPETKDNIREAFKIFDRDASGYISASELRHVLTNLGEKLVHEQVDEMIRETEMSADGQVRYEDFVDILCSGK